MTADEARRLFAEARVARLASAGAGGVPHVVPIVFALALTTIYSAVDQKPKRTRSLRRLRNVAENPLVAVLADHYDDDWRKLWWVRADGRARILDAGDVERRAALELLAARYPQYIDEPPDGPVLAIDVERWSGWAAG